MAKEKAGSAAKVDTKKKLIKAGIRLFSQYGYAATSTRMIASEAGVNLSAIAFHYSSKECLYAACLEYILMKIEKYYEASYTEIDQAFTNNEMTKEKAYALLGRMIDLQIHAAFGKEYQTTLALIYWESNGPDDIHPLSSAVLGKQEHMMADLLMILAPMSEKRAMLISRHINGSIIAFGEHKKLIESYVDTERVNGEVPYWVYQEIKANCLAIIDRVVYNQNSPARLLVPSMGLPQTE